MSPGQRIPHLAKEEAAREMRLKGGLALRTELRATAWECGGLWLLRTSPGGRSTSAVPHMVWNSARSRVSNQNFQQGAQPC